MPERPDSLTLVPGEAGRTDPVHRPRVGWDAGGRLHLGLPILQFTVDELLDDQRFGLFSSILEYWVLNDLRNILHQQRCWPCSWSGTWFPARTLTGGSDPAHHGGTASSAISRGRRSPGSPPAAP